MSDPFADEHRWRCTKCGQEVPEERHEKISVPRDECDRVELILKEVPIELGDDTGDVIRFHKRCEAVSAGHGRIGCYMRQINCGPIRLAIVGYQEQFVEWLEGKYGGVNAGR